MHPLCTACGDEVFPEEAHYFGVYVYHEECCPACKEEASNDD